MSLSKQNEPSRFVRILTLGKALPEIEDEILQAMSDGARVLLSTGEGLSRRANISARSARTGEMYTDIFSNPVIIV